MNLDFLKNEIIPQREKEIEEWKNAWTRHPIYVVYNVIESYTTLDNEYSNLEDLTLYWYEPEDWYFKWEEEWWDSEDFEWIEDYDNATCTKFFRDVFTAIFFTRKWAEEYMKYQSHNLSDKAYIYTHYSWYANQEMDRLLDSK